MRGFTIGEVSRITGIHKDTLAYWARTDFVPPSVQQAQGKGTNRLYSFRDLVQLKVSKRLRDAGISLQGLRSVVNELNKTENLATPLAETFLVTDGKDVYLVVNDERYLLSLLQQPGQGVLSVLNLSETVKEAKEAAKEREVAG